MGSEHQHTSGRAQGDPAGCSCRAALGLSEWAWTGEGILIFFACINSIQSCKFFIWYTQLLKGCTIQV